MKHAHTPTPWFIQNRKTHWSIGLKKQYSYRDTIADLPQWSGDFVGHGSREETESNAAHIVKCVNNHESLVSALKMILMTHDLSCKGEECQISGIDLARDVLERVK